MAEPGDLTVLHKPFCNLQDYGETDAGGRTFDPPATLLGWLRDEALHQGVFLKDTTDHQHDEVLAGLRFLAEARHVFLIRPPPLALLRRRYVRFPGGSAGAASHVVDT